MEMPFWSNRRVRVTSGTGFLGFHPVEKLRARGCQQLFATGSRDYDLRSSEDVQRSG